MISSTHASIVPKALNAFGKLGVGVSVVTGEAWQPVNIPSNVIEFEFEHGREAERADYNRRLLAEVCRHRTTVEGTRAGLFDLFVPVGNGRSESSVIVCGPLLRALPTSTELSERWHWLSGRKGHPSDPEFAHYVARTLETPLFDGKHLERLRRLLECFAALLAERGDPEALRSEVSELDSELGGANLVTRTWSAVRNMLDRRLGRSWAGPYRQNELRAIGLSRLPDQVLVALAAPVEARELDPVEALLRRHELQRACTELAARTRDVVVGRVGEHGVAFLAALERGRGRRDRLLSLYDQASALALRRFSLGLHAGASLESPDEPLYRQFQAALGSAEVAVARGHRVVRSEHVEPLAPKVLRELRRELARAVQEHPAELGARFDRYVEAVASYCGHLLAPVRAHLESGLESMVSGLSGLLLIGPRDLDDLLAALDEASQRASTVGELYAAYRLAVTDIVASLERPVEARRARGLRRAMAYIEEQLPEPLTLAQVARVAGFAPGYFSELFRRQERTTFERYLRGLRIERAKRLLLSTELSVERVGQLSGFPERHYFHRAFRALVGVTPTTFRKGGASG